MKVKTSIHLCLAIAFLLSSCVTAPRTIYHTQYIPPDTKEGKECVQECKKLKIMESQLVLQKYLADKAEHDASCNGYSTSRLRNQCKSNDGLLTSGRDLDEYRVERDYDKCFEDCGGKIKVTTSIQEGKKIKLVW
jgi:hypothetical protein